jgi:hypothetical protein
MILYFITVRDWLSENEKTRVTRRFQKVRSRM